MFSLYKIVLTSLLVLVTNELAFSQEDELCEPKGTLNLLLSYVQDIEDKCLEDIHEKNKKAVREEVRLLMASVQEIDKELPKVAISINLNQVRCTPSAGQAMDRAKVKRCQELIQNKNLIAKRIDFLMGWDRNVGPKTKPTKQTVQTESPCPKTEELNNMQFNTGVNPQLRKIWTECRLRNDLGG